MDDSTTSIVLSMSHLRGYMGHNQHRTLEGDNNSPSSPSAASSSSDDESFLVLLTTIVSLICLFYILCTYQLLRRWLIRWLRNRGGQDEVAVSSDTVVVHDGRVFNLMGDQRRAVLEAIFSPTSKTATELNVSQKKKKRKLYGSERGVNDSGDDEMNAGEVPYNVEIPALSTAGTDDEESTSAPSPDQSRTTCSSDQQQYSSEFEPQKNGPNFEQQPMNVNSGVDGEYSDEEDDIVILTPNRSRESENDNDIDDDSTMSVDSPGRSFSQDDDDDKQPIDDADNCDGNKNIVRAGFLRFNSMESDSIYKTPSRSVDEEGLSTPLGLASPIAQRSSFEDAAGGTPKAGNSGLMPTDLTPLRGNLNLQSLDEDDDDDTINSDDGDMKSTADLSFPDLPSARQLREASSRSFVIPEHEPAEETKEEIGMDSASEAPSDRLTAVVESLSNPISLHRRESFTTVASEYTFDDDSCTTGDNVCPICLCGYKKGDTLIVANHCTHMFHKDCILEWLDKHDDCPVCRTGMVTDSEMNLAATSLVGKTRMYRAVASLRSSSSPAPRPSSSPTHTGPSPFRGTVRRAAASRSPYHINYM